MTVSTGYRLYMDGNAWCAVGPHFKCLATDPAGFGETQEVAVAALNAEPSHRTWLRRINGQPAKLEDFAVEKFCSRCKEFYPEDIAADGCRDPGCTQH